MKLDDEAIVVETAANPAAAVIWLHGLGADGHDFPPVVPELGLPSTLSIRFIFPHAPVRPVTINGGHRMRAWYDMFMGDRGLQGNAEHIRESAERLAGMVEAQQQAGIASSRIVLAGFSQGGAVALHCGLRRRPRVAGILALSTYLPLRETVADELPDRDLPPVFMAHGSFDDVIPFGFAEASCQALQAHGAKVEWHDYPMAHSVCMEELQATGAWLQRRLS